MGTTTVSSRDFNQDVGRAKRAAQSGPVIITDRGRPAHVLMTIDDYRRMTGGRRDLADALSMPGLSDVAFEPGRVEIVSCPATLR